MSPPAAAGIDSRHAYRHAVQRVLWTTLALNGAVALAKLVVGLRANSLTLVGDAAHSGVDGINNVIGLIAVGLAAKEADADHPYGHSKFETLAAFFLSGLLFLTCAQIVIEAVRRLTHAAPDAPRATAEAFVVTLVTLAVNLVVTNYEARRGRELDSDFLIADAAHTRSDVLVTAAVLVSLVLVHFGLPRFDALISLIVAGLIGRIGYAVFRRTLPVLVDASAVDEPRIQEIVRGVPGVRSAHAIRSRRAGDTVFIEMHVLVEPNQMTEAAHAVTEAVEAALVRALGPTMATIHVETQRDCGF